MDKNEAKAILSEYIKRYRSKTYQDLLQLMAKDEIHGIQTGSGKLYYLEFQSFYDDSTKQNIIVIGSIGDKGIRSNFPICDDFIISPEGTFIAE
jgi:hypothetical protein